MVQNCLLSNSNPTRTVRWNTGQSSTYAIALTVNLKPDGTSVINGTGEVTAGLFKGARVEQVVVLPNTSVAACLSEQGMTEAAGIVTLTITPIP